MSKEWVLDWREWSVYSQSAFLFRNEFLFSEQQKCQAEVPHVFASALAPNLPQLGPVALLFLPAL